MKKLCKSQIAKTIGMAAVILVLMCAALISLLQKNNLFLVSLIVLGLLYISMLKKWKQLHKEKPVTAKVSVAIHILAIIIMLALLVGSFF